MAKKGMEARAAAAALLHGVLFDKRMISQLLDNEKGPLAGLTGPEKARAQSLAANVLRYLGRVDAVIDQYVEKSTPLKARNALRIATVEMLVDGIAPHAAVDGAVEIVQRSQKTARMGGLINAVSRKIAADGREIWESLSPQPLPGWLAKPVAKNFGREIVADIEKAHEAGAPLDLTLKSPQNLQTLATSLDAAVLPNGSLRLYKPAQITTLQGYESGDWWVQDAAASVPVRLLGDLDGQRVLDLCAAPGGKTMQLAAAGAEVTALDISLNRMARTGENLRRTGLQAGTVIADATAWDTDQQYDAIVLDAPCSATGTIRRHPDLTIVKAGADLSELFALQEGLIDKAVAWLRPGGKLVYCTCSLLPREGERQTTYALARHGNLEIVPPDLSAMGLDPDWIDDQGGLRLRPDYWPELGGMDGFYMAVLQKL